MRNTVLPVGLALVVSTLLSCAQQPVPVVEEKVSTKADVAAIRAFLANNESVISSGDLDGWADQFTEGAIFMRPDAQIVEGRDAGRESVRSWYELFDMGITASVDEIEVLGDWAFVRWSFAFQATPKAGGETSERNGKEIWILQRQSDGSWKCSHMIYNYDSAPPPSETS